MDQREMDNSSGSFDELESLDTKEKWGYDLETLYKIALQFFKDKEGKAFHLSYDKKCKLLAYTQQVKLGPFDPNIHGNVGVLDVIGKDRKIAWQKLGSMSRTVALASFVEILDQSCPLFLPYVEAKKKEAEMLAEKEKQEIEKEINEQKLKVLQEEEDARRKLETEEQEEKRKRIKEALNTQTFAQFKVYAEQQFPENPEQQGVLIRQLQEQHYIQYMQQIFQQQIMSQNYNNAQNEGEPQEIDAEIVALNALTTVQDLSLEGQENVSESSCNDHEDFSEIVAASMWTRKDIREFKESICKEGKDSIIKVGHGETVTVRVPTVDDGSCLFFEFATDSYDIGFGLFFEWTKSATEQQVSVHVSDSEDTEDDDADEDNVTEEDIEQGGVSSKSDLLESNRPPLSVIIPVYRRDCQEEVYAGSHSYPGQGVYLLKFDNSYSLWRSKTLYYRVYYTR